MNKLIEKYKPYIDELTSSHKAQWGKMTAQHMIEHLILAVQMSNGKLNIECFNPPEKIPTLKRFLFSSRPLPKNFVNPFIGEELKPFVYDSLEKAKESLFTEIELYYSYFTEIPSRTTINATFGELNFEEWEIFHEKHFTHHLSQFGLMR